VKNALFVAGQEIRGHQDRVDAAVARRGIACLNMLLKSVSNARNVLAVGDIHGLVYEGREIRHEPDQIGICAKKTDLFCSTAWPM